MYNRLAKKIFAWCGPISLICFFAGMIIAGFFPPISPSTTKAEIVALYQENRTGLLVGMNIVMMGGMFVFPFIALMTQQMLRIKGACSTMAYGQLAAGTFGVVGFSFPGIFFLIAAYRADQSPDILYFINDFGWIFTVLPWPFQFMVNIFIGLAILSDKGTPAVFPRWFGYFSLWMAVLLVPASALVFFESGPFSWSGIFPYYIPGAVFGLYFNILAVLLVKAIDQEYLESRGDSYSQEV
jgi:hypothetical protein